MFYTGKIIINIISRAPAVSPFFTITSFGENIRRAIISLQNISYLSFAPYSFGYVIGTHQEDLYK